MITDYYSKTIKKRAQETATEQDTPQDKERMKITPTTRGILRRAMIRQATTGHMKAIPKAQDWDDQEEPIEDYDYDVAHCRGLRGKFRHHFTSSDACMVCSGRIYNKIIPMRAKITRISYGTQGFYHLLKHARCM
jgi:hypothetical protein